MKVAGKQPHAHGLADAAALGEVHEQIQARARIDAGPKGVVGERRHPVAHEQVIDQRPKLTIATAAFGLPSGQRSDPLRLPEREQDQRLMEGGVVEQPRREAGGGVHERA